MTYRRQKRAAGFGFEAEAHTADFNTFTRWYDRRCLLSRPSRAELLATLGVPATFKERAPAPVREAT